MRKTDQSYSKTEILTEKKQCVRFRKLKNFVVKSKKQTQQKYPN